MIEFEKQVEGTFLTIANELPQSCAEDADLSGKQVCLQSVAKF